MGSSQVTPSPLSRGQPWPKESQEGRQAASVLPDQRVAEAEDGAEQLELRREAGKEGEVGQADFHASDQQHKGWERQGQRCHESSSTGSGHPKEAMGLYTDFQSQASGPKEMRGQAPAQQGGMRECLSLLQRTLPGTSSMPGTG